MDELSKIIDKCLKPLEVDKDAYAEVTSPFTLRQPMLDLMPED